MRAVTCPYCGQEAELVYGNLVYPHRRDLYEKVFYRCAPCDAHVGCHAGTLKPLGRLANAELRHAKMAAHAALDPLWRGNGRRSRGSVYLWLADQLGIPRRACHIGEFDVAQCRRVVEIIAQRARPLQNVPVSDGEKLNASHDHETRRVRQEPSR